MICPGTDDDCDNPGCRRGGCQGRRPGPLMAMAAMIECPTCGGQGTVPHAKRTLGKDDHGVTIIDPHDHQTDELCQKCGGGGKAPAGPSASG